jgi:GDP-L-fucose synthase
MSSGRMTAEARIYVAGHRGLAGSAICRELARRGFRDVAQRTRAELDLHNHAAVERSFRDESPQFVFLAAAKVGGILANNTYPADFIEENLVIQTNVIRAARRANVKRLLFLGSSCIYPREAPQPLKEEYLLTSALEPTNRPYAIAKIAGIEMCWSSNRQHGTRYLCAMPTNLYGPGDKYDLQNSHVLPALLRKTHEALASHAKNVTVWGSGAPRREFLYSDDMARACVDLMTLPDEAFDRFFSGERPPLINIGSGQDLTITELANIIKRCVGFRGELVFDRSKPDGMSQKLLDVSRMFELGWKPRVPLEEGIPLAYADFLARFGSQLQLERTPGN